MRFYCDEMLARLARLLRAAGYDTALAEKGESDTAILARVRGEARVLVTRDRGLAARAAPAAVLLATGRLDDQAKALTAVLPIDWQAAPFTRCTIDNADLREATLDEVARMPAEARALGGPYRACPVCGRLYWPGSHVKRIAARLAGLGRQA